MSLETDGRGHAQVAEERAVASQWVSRADSWPCLLWASALICREIAFRGF